MRFISNVLNHTHPEWHEILKRALADMSVEYLLELDNNEDWLPGKSSLLAAFRRPLSSVTYILLGESPYPRVQSANGYAFWDGAVGSLWSETGLSKDVNRATSLRNFIKMLLHARGDLQNDFSQGAISSLDKSIYVPTAEALFGAFLEKGFLLLNASLVYSKGQIPKHAKNFRPFMSSLLKQLADINPLLQLVLLGKMANLVPEATLFSRFVAEHPYNISFITNQQVLHFFYPLDLLKS